MSIPHCTAWEREAHWSNPMNFLKRKISKIWTPHNFPEKPYIINCQQHIVGFARWVIFDDQVPHLATMVFCHWLESSNTEHPSKEVWQEDIPCTLWYAKRDPINSKVGWHLAKHSNQTFDLNTRFYSTPSSGTSNKFGDHSINWCWCTSQIRLAEILLDSRAFTCMSFFKFYT